jgi:hypothetical protein
MTTPYSAQIRHVELLERDKAQTTTLSIYRDNALVVPTSAKYTLRDENGNAIVDDQTATIESDGVISYAHTSSELASTLDLGEGYLQEFHATLDGVVHIFRRMCAIVLRRLYPVVSDVDLTSIYTDLEEVRPSSLTSYQKYIDDAWFQILRKIRSKGMGFEYLVMSADSFYESHRHLALYLIFRDFHSSLGQSNGRYLELAQEHHRMYIQEFDAINFIYDEQHQNKPTDSDSRISASPVIYTNGRSHYRYFRFNRFRRY